jgi:flagellar hook-associated protein 1 FlgK
MPVALSNLLHVARDAMSVNAKALDVTGQNIANVNTAGYARRRVEIQARAATQDSYGGVTVGSITRAADQLTQRRLLDVRGQEQSARERGDALAPIEAAFNDANGTGLAGGLTRLFDAFNTLASKPTDTTARAGVLSAAQGVVEGFALVTESIDTARADLFAKAQGYTRQLNETARAIADLNGSIQSALSAGQDAADLLDRRDQLLGGLSELVDVQVATNPNGTLFVRAAGQALVEGNTASSFSVDLDAAGNLAFKTAVGGGTPTAFNAGAMGGKLGGIRQARDEDMTATRQRLDTLAGDLATAVNTLHGAGFGLDGQTGRPLFAFTPAVGVRSLAVDPNVAGRPERIAASASAATGGNDVARQLAGLDSSKASAGGTKTLLDSYADLVGDLGLRRQKASGDAEVKGALADQVEALQQSATGVSLDEEMVELTRFQRAYEASSKLLKTFDELMQTLINSA